MELQPSMLTGTDQMVPKKPKNNKNNRVKYKNHYGYCWWSILTGGRGMLTSNTPFPKFPFCINV